MSNSKEETIVKVHRSAGNNSFCIFYLKISYWLLIRQTFPASNSEITVIH